MERLVLDESKMSEAEVTLRLAISLISNGHTKEDVVTAIDGAQVKIGETVHFQILEFLSTNGWLPNNKSGRWQCAYKNKDYQQSIVVHSNSGEGDLVATLNSGKRLRVESKKGPLVRSKSSQEYPLIREAIGQLMTIEHADPNDVLSVAVPSSEKFNALAAKWRERPLMKSTNIHIVTVDRDNVIKGLENVGI